MRGKELLEKMELVDPAYVEAADGIPKKKKRIWGRWGAIAACFCLIAAAAAAVPRFLPGGEPSPAGSGDLSAPINAADLPIQADPILPDPAEGGEYAEGPQYEWTAVFNEAVTTLDAARQYIPGYFTEELNEKELAALEPAMRWEYMEYSGFAGFDGNGDLIEVVLEVTTSVPEQPVRVTISQNVPPQSYVTEEEPVVSPCDRVDYTVYRWTPTDRRIVLEADAEIEQYYFCFTLETAPEGEEMAKKEFRMILECFSRWADGKPDLSAVKADVIPEFFDRTLTLSEARGDADFGAYMPDAAPSGFGEEALRRYKDQNSDYLSGLWTRGYDELRWQVTFYTEEDAERLTGIDETENYDLSLYPIPRADSVPDEKRAIVNDPIFPAEELTLDAVCSRAYRSGERGDSDGWRMTFSVRYDDILVRVSAKGVEPEWVYEQLKGLAER